MPNRKEDARDERRYQGGKKMPERKQCAREER